MQDGLGIRSRPIVMTALFQPRPEVGVVVDFAVEDHPDAGVFVRHWLLSAVDVNNRQTAMSQSDGTVDVQAIPVRSAMPHDVAHRRQPMFVDAIARIKSDDSSDSTHTFGWSMWDALKRVPYRN